MDLKRVNGRHAGAVVSTVASKEEGPEIKSPPGEWALLLVSVWVLSGYSGVLPQSKDMQVDW